MLRLRFLGDVWHQGQASCHTHRNRCFIQNCYYWNWRDRQNKNSEIITCCLVFREVFVEERKGREQERKRECAHYEKKSTHANKCCICWRYGLQIGRQANGTKKHSDVVLVFWLFQSVRTTISQKVLFFILCWFFFWYKFALTLNLPALANVKISDEEDTMVSGLMFN